MAKDKQPKVKEAARPPRATFRSARSCKPRSGYGKAWDFHLAQALRLARASTYVNRSSSDVANAPPTRQEVSEAS